jgi:hypothetical protein
MNGKLQQKSISEVFQIDRTVVEVLFLAFIGALAIVMRAKLRIPLNMPGHHGFEVMALLLIGRRISKISFASSISTLVAAVFIMLPFMGFKDPFLPLIYLLMGGAIDLIYRYFGKYKENIIFLALLGGIVYMMIPLSRILIHFTTGFPYALFLKVGYVYPVVSHFIFGALGATFAAGLFYSAKRLKK